LKDGYVVEMALVMGAWFAAFHAFIGVFNYLYIGQGRRGAGLPCAGLRRYCAVLPGYGAAGTAWRFRSAPGAWCN
jgi:hypothetical protein